MLSIVIPCYQSEDYLESVVTEILEELADLPPLEIILVDDGSIDGTWAVITNLSLRNRSVRGLRLHKNTGQHFASLAGARDAVGDFTMTIDDDGQYPPAEIKRLVEAIKRSDCDLLYGFGFSRSQSRFRNLTGRIFRRFIANLSGEEAMLFQSSFRVFRSSLLESKTVLCLLVGLITI